MEFTAYGPTGAREHGGVSKQLPANLKTVDAHAHLWIDAAQKIAAPFLKDIVIPLERYTSDATKIANKKHYDERSHYLKNIELRIEDMNARNIDIQAVIPVPKQSYYWIPIEPAKEALRAINEGVAAAVKTAPDRFVGFGAIPMQDVDAALKEMEYCVNQLGFKGIQILTNINGEEISIPKVDPIWAKAQELDVPIFIHPNGSSNIIKEDGLAFAGDQGNIIGNPLETTLFLTRLMFDGTFDRFPGLKICGAHGGGYLPSYFGRAEVACSAFGGPAINADGEFVGVDPIQADDCKYQKPPREYLKTQIFADSMVFSDEGLRHLVAEMGASQVVYGTDMPLGWPDTMDIILNSVHLSNADKEAIMGGNLIRLLKLNRAIDANAV